MKSAWLYGQMHLKKMNKMAGVAISSAFPLGAEL